MTAPTYRDITEKRNHNKEFACGIECTVGKKHYYALGTFENKERAWTPREVEELRERVRPDQMLELKRQIRDAT